MLIHNKDDIEFVTEFPCLLGHPVWALHGYNRTFILKIHAHYRLLSCCANNLPELGIFEQMLENKYVGNAGARSRGKLCFDLKPSKRFLLTQDLKTRLFNLTHIIVN